MRIQHNIMAMNAYRNYSNNTSALSKNLEKLSSGYKINRAGDDAAGLAISEKMRAQIKGLEAAQKNVKDGISLVKTAEGAMQEIQDMLNRMKYLATQSANGTYDKEVDRTNLQKEVDSLREEINRISESANFNGINLLDGTWQGKTTLDSVKTGNNSTPSVATKIGALSLTTADGGDSEAVDAKDAATTAASVGGIAGFSFKSPQSGELNGKKITVNLDTSVSSGTDTAEIDADGNLTVTLGGDNASSDFDTAAKLKTAIQGAIRSADFAGDVDASKQTELADVKTAWASVELTVPAEVTGFTAVTANGKVIEGTFAGGVTAVPAGKTPAKTEIDFKDVTGANAIGSTLTIAGKTYEFVEDAEDAADDNTAVVVTEGDNAATVLTALKTAVDTDTVLAGKFTVGTSGTKLTITESASPATGTEKAPTVTGTGFKATSSSSDSSSAAGLMLQIGDTSDDFNQLNVEIGEMSTTAMGIDGIDISDQTGAAAAINTIKDAINYVSSVRGDLGAYQNRLEHTANNLSVMTENIQDAESTIRDTDVAEEMMKYTKNNILIQSAQAMLAQANAVPQGVLQLLG